MNVSKNNLCGRGISLSGQMLCQKMEDIAHLKSHFSEINEWRLKESVIKQTLREGVDYTLLL